MTRHWSGLRGLLVVLMALFIATMLSGLATSAGNVKVTMFIFAAPGHNNVPRELVADYLKRNPNVEVEFNESSNAFIYPRMVAAKLTTPDKPIVNFGEFNIDVTTKGDVDKMWLPFDPSNVPNLDTIEPKFRRTNDVGVFYSYGPFGLAYSSRFVTEPPTSYRDLWENPRFKGRVVLWDYTWQALIMAARLNGGSEKNIDAGFETWAKHADQLHSLITSNEQLKNLLVSGEAWLTLFDLSQVQVWRDQGAPVGIAIPKEGVIAWPLTYQVVAGSTPEQKRVAEQIINVLIAPANLIKYSLATYYAPTTSKTRLPEKLAKLPQFDPKVLANAIALDYRIAALYNDAWRLRWDREVKARMR